jgi:6-phosphofructokinase
MSKPRLGIIVGGGPAPGINAVIGAATIEAINRDFEVYGYYDGFRWLSSERFDAAAHSVKLEISAVARIHFDGGSILRTARTSLLDDTRLAAGLPAAPDPLKVERVVRNLARQRITHLLTIGGDDTALSACFVCDASQGGLRLVHVPKTIDNDLPLPGDALTFGSSTARYIGTSLVKNLMVDSQTTGRWYLVETMGRSSGWLAMSIGMSAGATITLIPEEFGDQVRLQDIADVIEGAILKRRAMGRPDGVALLAEGLAYRLGDVAELERVLGRSIPLDAAGHPRLSEVDLSTMLKEELLRRFKARGDTCELISHELGYELRSADPTPFDMGYCRSLGYFSVHLLMNPDRAHAGVMVAIVNGNLHPIHLRDLIDPRTGRTRVRTVDIRSDVYRVARAYMIRLERADLENTDMLERLATTARITPEEFAARYGGCIARSPNGP